MEQLVIPPNFAPSRLFRLNGFRRHGCGRAALSCTTWEGSRRARFTSTVQRLTPPAAPFHTHTCCRRSRVSRRRSTNQQQTSHFRTCCPMLWRASSSNSRWHLRRRARGRGAGPRGRAEAGVEAPGGVARRSTGLDGVYDAGWLGVVRGGLVCSWPTALLWWWWLVSLIPFIGAYRPLGAYLPMLGGSPYLLWFWHSVVVAFVEGELR